ncbi:MAG: Histidine triad (HIT) nucleotide-binding protein, similarity with At5g48545 and yeast YDL125C (HNT1), partial [uncultured Acidimicrobiales bacterium]
GALRLLRDRRRPHGGGRRPRRASCARVPRRAPGLLRTRAGRPEGAPPDAPRPPAQPVAGPVRGGAAAQRRRPPGPVGARQLRGGQQHRQPERPPRPRPRGPPDQGRRPAGLLLAPDPLRVRRAPDDDGDHDPDRAQWRL